MVFNSPIALLKGIRADFAKKLAQDYNIQTNRFTYMTESDSNKETYPFFDAFPAVQEWVDKIDYEKFKIFKYEIANKPWQWGIPVDRDTIEDSRASGMFAGIQQYINQGVQKWKFFQYKLVSELIKNGASGLAFDGTAFFATDRPNLKGSTAIDNLKSGSGITLANLETDLDTAMGALRGYIDRNDEPFNVAPKFLVICSPALERKFLNIKGSELLATTAITSHTNVFQNTFDVLVMEYLSDNDWYLVNENATIKPFIYQSRKNPLVEMKDENDSPIIKYFSTARMSAGYGNPTAIVKVNN